MKCLKSAVLKKNFSICNQRINENDTLHAPLIPQSKIDKLFNSILKVKSTKDGNISFGTGFFIKLNIKNVEMSFILTCNHVVSEQNIDEYIEFYQGQKGDEEILKIKLDIKERYIRFFPKPVDITLIQILENDLIRENKFLYPDLDYKNGYNNYKYKKYYLAGYPKNDSENINKEYERCISSGTIINLNEEKEFEFEHDLDTRLGSSGGPICLYDSLLVIGIHNGGDSVVPVNFGTFLGYILEELNKEEIEEEIPINGSLEKINGFNDNDDNDESILEAIETCNDEKYENRDKYSTTLATFKSNYKILYKKWNK